MVEGFVFFPIGELDGCLKVPFYKQVLLRLATPEVDILTTCQNYSLISRLQCDSPADASGLMTVKFSNY